ncbi:putative l-amino acid oxidase [Diaporthe ampelina]|uniref:Putative l-amino acid oxidase n=1 Tax=Diaporthe ampelina TaxID=1214573 RepID=A0A0G2FWJ1_9PEZI|nr:putative l-amino acid oxidase [Diaporthe ampelina]
MMSSTQVSTTKSAKARWAGRLIREKLAAELNVLRNNESPAGFQSSVPFTHDTLPTDRNYDGDKRTAPGGDWKTQPPRKVCIVGAGVAGLYIAMILDSLKIPELNYDILEASSRVGGRAFTHHFSEKRHDYYDIGAMRYPHIPTMDRTFNLFDQLHVPTVPYILDNPKAPKLFNDRHFSEGFDPYHVSVKNGGSVPDEVVDNAEKILGDVFGAFKDAMAHNFEAGFAKLMEYDNFSTREFLKRMVCGPLQEKLYDFFAIQWMETQDTSTNLFDQAFSESVMDSFDFDYPTKDKNTPVKWSCIEGGTSVLSDLMQKSLNNQPEVNKRVEAISIDRDLNEDGNMSVKCADETEPRLGYCTVFNTTTLGCLGRIDLRGLELHPSQKDAIRSLHYDESVKVALKFKYPWWIVDCGIRGGVGSTDLPLRTCVYPSYNLGDGADKPAVLLASYTWAQDATRMGSLVDRQQRPEGEDELVELILRNLARLHAEHISYDKIKEAFTGEYHAYAWSHDPNTAGAFALFAPGQFSNLYPYLSRPAADSKFHIVGEAASAHHAWIVGALDSAYTAVYRFLYRFKMWHALDKLVKDWGLADELEIGEEGTVHLQVALGKLRKEDQYRV